MLRSATRSLSILCALLACSAASALDFKSLGDNAIVYDASSTRSQPQFILLKGTPVELIVAVERWAKVREQSGGMGWVERRLISDLPQVIVTASSVEARQQGSENAPVVFSAARDVLLEVVEKPAGAWLKVKHRDGQTGFVPLKSVWGI